MSLYIRSRLAAEIISRNTIAMSIVDLHAGKCLALFVDHAATNPMAGRKVHVQFRRAIAVPGLKLQMLRGKTLRLDEQVVAIRCLVDII